MTLPLGLILKTVRFFQNSFDKRKNQTIFKTENNKQTEFNLRYQRLGLLQLFEENSYRKTFGYHSCWGSDQVTNIPCGTGGGVMIFFEKVEA